MPLFQTIDELKLYVPVDGNLSPATFLPSMQQAEDDFIIEVLGPTQYNDLLTAYEASSLSGIQSQLLDAVRKAEAKLGMYLLFPILSVRIGDSGILTAGGVDQQRAMQWQVDDTRNQLLFDGYQALDNLYTFLFNNKGLFPDWTSSTAFSLFTQYFINQVSDFQRNVSIDNSNWIFRKMVPIMENIEIDEIYNSIGQPFFDYLKGQISAGTLAGDDLIAVQMIRKAIALLTYGRALIEPDFTELISIFKRPRSDAQDRRKWEKPDYSILAETYSDEGTAMLERLKITLNSNASATVYASYFTSNWYCAPQPADKFRNDEYDNRHSKSSFFM